VPVTRHLYPTSRPWTDASANGMDRLLPRFWASLAGWQDDQEKHR
jgi:hypothetical protein